VQDDYAAIHWYERASRTGHIESTTAYGWMLANGRGAQIDIDESRRVLKIAAAKGDITAHKFLVEMSHSR
jgi:TPR repeat protein